MLWRVKNALKILHLNLKRIETVTSDILQTMKRENYFQESKSEVSELRLQVFCSAVMFIL